MPRTGLVYLVTSPSGRRYVGLTVCTLRERKRKHIRAAASGRKSPFMDALRRFGEQMCWEILIEGVPEHVIGKVEQKAILIFGTKTDGYNLRDGGRGGGGLSTKPEVRTRQIGALVASSKARRGKGTRGPTKDETRKLIAKNNAWYWTDEKRREVGERMRALRAVRFWSHKQNSKTGTVDS